MDKNTTAYWSKKFSDWWDTTGSKQKKPRYPNELKEGYRLAKKSEIASGTKSTPLIIDGRQAAIEVRGPNQGFKVVYQDTVDVKGSNRRAQTQNKTISVEDREAWYKRNNYPNARERAEADFQTDAKARAATKARARARTNNGIHSIYEHLSPLAVEEQRAGGFESARNTVVAPAKENGYKSDKVASTKVLREQQVPVTRSSAIRADARKIPIKGTDASRFNTVYDDITSFNRPKASALKKLSRGLPVVGGIIAGSSVLLNGGDAKAAALAVVDGENPINDLDGGDLFNESEDFQSEVDYIKSRKPLGKAVNDVVSNEAEYIRKTLMNGTLPYNLKSIPIPGFTTMAL